MDGMTCHMETKTFPLFTLIKKQESELHSPAFSNALYNLERPEKTDNLSDNG